MKRRAFFSFHYKPDNWRASQVRSMGMLEGNEPCSDNDWESITRGGDSAIMSWIAKQLNDKSCAVVLVGAATAGRPWITYEIQEAWNSGKGVVGIRINNLKDVVGLKSFSGGNPFDHLHFIGDPSRLASSVIELHDPPYFDSKYVYGFICDHLEQWIEDAIYQRSHFSL